MVKPIEVPFSDVENTAIVPAGDRSVCCKSHPQDVPGRRKQNICISRHPNAVSTIIAVLGFDPTNNTQRNA